MDELGDKLNAVLNDPGQLERLTRMAKSIMGGEPSNDSASKNNLDSDGIDPAMLRKLSAFMGKSSVKNDKRALLEAMKPYLSEKRRKKMDKALKLAKLASFAELAVGEFGQDDD